MSLYFKSILMLIRSEMEYKTSFIFTMIGSALSTFLAVLSIIFTLDKFGAVRWMDYK